MSNEALDNLVKINRLKSEPYDESEYDGLVGAAQKRLTDAQNPDLDLQSRFDLAYSAAHRLALSALRYHGYRPDGRYLVFQTLGHTVGMDAAKWRVLSKCHDARNRSEYEGDTEVDPRLFSELLQITKELATTVQALPKR